MLASWGGSYANRGCAAREVRGDDRRGNLFSRPRKEVFSENREKTVLTVKGEVISCFTASSAFAALERIASISGSFTM